MDLFHFPFCHLSTLLFRLSPVPYFRLSVPFRRQHFSLGSGISRVSWNVFLSLESNCGEANPTEFLCESLLSVSEVLARFLIGKSPFDAITPAGGHESRESRMSEEWVLRSYRGNWIINMAWLYRKGGIEVWLWIHHFVIWSQLKQIQCR
jgi:hypothetical protein